MTSTYLSKGVKLILRGWIEENEEPYSNIPKKCPICGSELWKTDALKICGIYWVGCKDSQCRWQEVYVE